MKKTKAFTLTELLVVMIVATIVVSMAFLALSMVKKQVGSIQKKMIHKEELKRFEKILWRDFNYYGVGNYKTDNKLFFSNGLDAVEYKILENCILRNEDSIFITINAIDLFLDDKKVTTGNIDAIKIQTEEIYNKNIFVFTEKDATFYMNK